MSRCEALAHKILKLTEGEEELDDAVHAKIAQRLRELYHIVVSARPSSVLTSDSRYALLASGVAIGRGAISGRGPRTELVRTSALVALVSLGDGAPPDIRPNEQSNPVGASSLTYAGELRRDLPAVQEHAAVEELAEQLMYMAHEPCQINESLLDKYAFAYWMQCFQSLRGIMLDETTSVRNVEARSISDIIQDTYAQSLVEAADAELGQIVFRDLILSFRLPRQVVRQRRTLVLERTQTSQAEQDHADELNRAHSAAMQSPSDVWARGVIAPQESSTEVVGDFLVPELDSVGPSASDVTASENAMKARMRDEEAEPVERTCVLLAALAMNLSQSADAARTGDAFEGRVELPFLATRAPAPHVTRIALRHGEWFYYRMPLRRSTSSAHIEVLVRGPGLSGLLACAMAMLADEGGLHAAAVSS